MPEIAEKKNFTELFTLLEREERTGCQDASVFGGFSAHLLSLVEKLAEAGEFSSSKIPEELKRLFKDYAERPRAIRRERIEQARLLLQNIKPILPEASKQSFDPLSFSVQYVKGVGPVVAQKLQKLGIATVRDLLTHYPRRYEDRRIFSPIRQARWDEMQTIRGKIGKVSEVRPKRQLTITKMAISDGTAVAYLVWYNQPYLKNLLKPGVEVIAYGKLERKFGELQILNPEVEILSEDQETTLHTNRIVPIYPSTEALSQTLLRKVIFYSLEKHKHAFDEPLPQQVRQEYHLEEIQIALQNIHFPPEWVDLEKARRRLVFEEFFILQVFLALKKQGKQAAVGISFPIQPHWLEEFQEKLPFSLTNAQKRVMQEIAGDMQKPKAMHRLLQGDVGSGKTVVAAFAALCAIRSGYQAAYMAPTEILAEQHGMNLSKILAPFDIPVLQFLGDQTKSEREKVLRALQSGSGKLVIGTHALIQDDVFFRNLGLGIIDEQHKFGVLQRTTLKHKGNNPDILVMTATPIPRTLAMTLYGDLDVSVIDEMPKGRKPVKTRWVSYEREWDVWNFVRKEVQSGKQAFIVCPLVEESEKLEAASAVEEAERLRTKVFPDLSVALLHGRMKSDEKESAMEAFRSGKASILIATTVIEVGVDVPNATVMVVKNAERFGLSQLHQLRGRVGRGSEQAYCILLAHAKSQEAQERLEALCQSQDGFAIAEADLRLRGPGEFYGTRQHGLPDFKIANLIRDLPILEEARQAAFQLVQRDPHLALPEHKTLRDLLAQKFGKRAELL
jgi:ATP-dependent DNA helicase RecG